MTSKFERKFGRYAIKNLTLYLIIGYVIGFVIGVVNPELLEILTFNPHMIFRGEVWRIITWVITPPTELDIFTIVMLLLYYNLGTTLEKTWGTYRYNVYLFSGFLFTVAGALILYVVMGIYYATTGEGAYFSEILGAAIGQNVHTYYINMSIFLAFAMTYPDMQLLLYFIIPIKVKWFGILYAVMIGLDIVKAFTIADVVTQVMGRYFYGIIITVLIIMSLLNFIIYFVTGKIRGGHTPKQAKRRYEYKQSIKKAQNVNRYSDGVRHKCAVCGRTDVSNPELTFRFCSKCSGNKEYCQDHLFTHTHV